MEYMSCKRFPFPFPISTLIVLPIVTRYANEARIVWNGPLRHQAEELLKDSLDNYFGEGNEWHFYTIDKQRRPLVSFVSKVVDRLMKYVSKFPFMYAKKGRG